VKYICDSDMCFFLDSPTFYYFFQIIGSNI
jgi:hypothetical protein